MTLSLFLELLAKSSLIAATGLGLSVLLKFRPASDRATVLRASVGLVLALPLFLLIGPSLPLALLDAPQTTTQILSTESWTVDLQPIASATVAGSLPAAPPWSLIAAFAYAAGLLLVLGRFIIGVWTLSRWTEGGAPVAHQVWTEALRRLDSSGRTRLIASPRVEAPLSWGLPPGVVLIGDNSVRRPETAAAVLAHELAHIRRGDWIFLALSRLAVALFWFNPLVWLLHAVLSARTEEAADAAAVGQVDRQSYARALVDLASDYAHPAALGMASPQKSLTRRIASIMKSPRTSPSRPIAMTLTVGAMVAVATPLAAVELTARAEASAESAVAVQSNERPARSALWLSSPPPPAALSAPEPPAPPSALAFSAPPAPPPPAPPAPQSGWPQSPGSYRFYSNHSDTDIQRHAATEARAHAAQARAEARAHAAQARADAVRVRAEASHGEMEGRLYREIMEQVRVQTADITEQAMAEAQSAMVQARSDMRKGADDLEAGAADLRAEGLRLRDPDYRAHVIAGNRARAHAEGRLSTTTDAELQALSRSLPQQATHLEHQAVSLRRQASQGF